MDMNKFDDQNYMVNYSFDLPYDIAIYQYTIYTLSSLVYDIQYISKDTVLKDTVFSTRYITMNYITK